MPAISVDRNNFSSVEESQKTVLLDFYAKWCGPCRMLAPIVEDVADAADGNSDYMVGKIDVESEPELAKRFGVTSIPTLVVMKNGKEKKRVVGAVTKTQILDMLAGS